MVRAGLQQSGNVSHQKYEVASTNLRLGFRETCGGDVQRGSRGGRIGSSRLCRSGPILSERDMQVLETVDRGARECQAGTVTKKQVAEIIVRIYQ